MEPARHLRALPDGARAQRRLKRVDAVRLPAAASASEAAISWILELAGRFAPGVFSDIDREIDAKLARLPSRVGEFGYDPWGFSPAAFRNPLRLLALLYRHYFRVELDGGHNFPDGRVLVIANHAGQLPADGAMLIAGSILDVEPPRLLRAMAEYWMPTLPFIGTMGCRVGAVVGTKQNCEDLLRRDEAVIAFPEGVRGLNKTWDERYQLQRFGLGFMRLALATDTPILPAVIVGSEEQAPAFANLAPLARLIGAPAFPITPTFPLLGPLGLLPLPVKYHISFGAPLRFTGNPHDEDTVVERMVGEVRGAMMDLIERGLRDRRGVFF